MDELYGEVGMQFLLSELLLHTQPLNSSEQHTKDDLEFSSDFVAMHDAVALCMENIFIDCPHYTIIWPLSPPLRSH